MKSTGDRPIACVCGGHETSNSATVASSDAIIVDVCRMKAISMQDDGKIVTVTAGVLMEELAVAVGDVGGALPLGAGHSIGVVGFVVNGGASACLSRRLGLLGQCVTGLTMVDAVGDIHHLTPEDGERFTSLLGAGSALGIITEISFKVTDESIVQRAEQFVVGYNDREQAVDFSHKALTFMRDKVMPDESLLMWVVVSAKTFSVTFTFYDTFKGSFAEYVDTMVQEAGDHNMPVQKKHHFSTWFELTSYMWPGLRQLKGSPLTLFQHCCGTRSIPGDKVLDFIADTWIGKAPMEDAELTMEDFRTLGGATLKGRTLSSGNCFIDFFAFIAPIYDASNKTVDKIKSIRKSVDKILFESQQLDSLIVDFSGTHSQPDDSVHPIKPISILGSSKMFATVKAIKSECDASNRFRFHPHASFL